MTERYWDTALAYSKAHIPTCICGGKGYVRLNVPIGHPLFGVAIPCACRRAELERQHAAEARARCGIGEWQWVHWRLEAFDPDLCRPPECRPAMRAIYETCCRYAKEPYGFLTLTGTYGCGKTHLAYGIAQRLAARGVGVVAASVPDLLAGLRASIEDASYEQMFERLMTAAVLVLDDLGAERLTPWANEALYRLVNHRYLDRSPLIVTTNLALADLDPRIRSRLSEGALADRGFARILALPADDFRPLAGTNDPEVIANLRTRL